MTPAHLANLAIHVAAGTAGLAIGFTMLAKAKGTPTHRRLGRIFCFFTLLVCCSAAAGLVLFRFLPLFAVLTVLVLYQLVGGWRSVYTQDRGPSALDAGWTLLAVAFSIFLVPVVLRQPGSANIVVYSSLGALASIILYDTIRWLFPRRWYRTLWRYEHAYKLIASIFAMLSAFVGNVVRVGQPWSQIAPSAIGLMIIFYFFYRLRLEDKTRRAMTDASPVDSFGPKPLHETA